MEKSKNGKPGVRYSPSIAAAMDGEATSGETLPGNPRIKFVPSIAAIAAALAKERKEEDEEDE